MERQEKLDQIRIEKLQRRGWKVVPVLNALKETRYLLFLRLEDYQKYLGYPRSSAVLKYAAEFIYDLHMKKFTKQSVKINITKAEEVLYGRT